MIKILNFIFFLLIQKKMTFLILYNLYILFSGINSNNYYVSINSIIYSINIVNNLDVEVFNEFSNLFPLSINLTDNDNRGYFKLGSATNNFSFYSNSLIQRGDLVLLEDNSYALFYNSTNVNIKNIYIGNVISYNITRNRDINTYWYFDNLDNQINVLCESRLYGEDVYIDFGCNEYGGSVKKVLNLLF